MMRLSSLSLTVISVMEVPRRPQPSSLTLPLPKPASSALPQLGAAQKVVKTDPVSKKLQERDGAAERNRRTEEESEVTVTVEDETSEAEDSRLSSQDSSVSEERSAQEAEEARKKSEEERAAAKERERQRQQLAIEELVQSERNYLRLLQVSTVTIRSNLQKLQVGVKAKINTHLGLHCHFNLRRLVYLIHLFCPNYSDNQS